MTKRLFCRIVFFTVGALALLCRTATAEIPYATDAPKPLTTEESVAAFQLPDDLRIELVASEPNIVEPGAMAFDEFGRLFVGQLHGYNLEGYYDIVELNKTGELDREVRRVRVEGPALERARNEAVGVIKLLEDKDGDGHFETATVWADDLPPSYGLVRARDGLIAVCPPEVLYLADLDNDGRAEHREVLFRGFGFEVLERGISAPRRGADNWIYVSAGGGGGEITGPYLAAPVQLGHTNFRIRDDGSAIEAVTGTASTFGMALTDFGDRFSSWHAVYATPLEYRHLIRNPHVPSPGGNARAADYRRVYPISEPNPWRVARNEDPNWVKFYGQGETTPNGYFTGACGPFVYGGGSLTEVFVGNHFICSPANNLVHRSVLRRDGAGFVTTRAPSEATSEFLSSTDRWFRPISLETGPDGALYIIDFYREIIEDYSAIPRHLQQRYIDSLRAGYEHGRIWRVTAKDRPGGKQALLGEATATELVAALESPNPWNRETAQRLLIGREDKNDVSLLRRLLAKSKSATARLHALYTLDALGALQSAQVESALSDTSYGVRLHGLRIAESWMNTSAPVRRAALALATDSDAAVRLQAAQSFGARAEPEALDALATIAADYGDERWMSAAIASAAATNPGQLLENLLQRPESTSGTLDVLPRLATTLAAVGSGREIDRLLMLVATRDGESSSKVRVALLDGLAEGLKNNPSRAIPSDLRYGGLMDMLSGPESGVRERALQVAGLLKLGDSPVMQEAWAAAKTTLIDRELPLGTRLAAVNLLVAAPWEQKAALGALLDPREPVDLQLAALRTIGAAESDAVAPMLLGAFERVSPRVQTEILDGLFMREDRLGAVLDAVEQGVIPAGAIPPIRRLEIRESGSKAMRERAETLLGARRDAERAAIIERFKPALALARDVKRGEAIFGERCATCHVLRGAGQEVGPDLSAVRTRPDETLLSDMLDPSGVITAGYSAYLVSTEDGGLYSGTLAEETATSVTLRRAGGEADVILRNQIEAMEMSPLSLMPDGLEEGLAPQDVADLLGYLRDVGGSFNPAGVVVFEDEAEFVAALTEGSGTAELSATNPYSGSHSLRVTPLQRHSRQIKGWAYRVVENPNLATDGPLEEIRYLRLAWKTEGDGVLIELADNGGWPPAGKALRRYFSGTNRTNWQATQVSGAVPKDWAVITVDLWKDFGEFTLTGIAPTAMGGAAYFDRIELLASIDAIEGGEVP
jgi:putative membrane-bound dehydrogenase-like protein